MNFNDSLIIRNFFGSGAHHALLVDDDPGSAQAMLTVLNHFQIDVTIAFDGAQAVQLIKNNFFDMLVLDWNMPEFDGKSVIEAMYLQLAAMGARRRGQLLDMPIVIHTGLVLGEILLPPEAGKFKCVELLRKPAMFADVERIVTKVLA